MDGFGVLSSEIAKTLGRNLTVDEAREVTKIAIFASEQSSSLNGTPIFTVTEEEMASLHETLSRYLRSMGLTGASLDEAIAASFHVAIQHIDRDRLTKMDRRSSLVLV